MFGDMPFYVRMALPFLQIGHLPFRPYVFPNELRPVLVAGILLDYLSGMEEFIIDIIEKQGGFKTPTRYSHSKPRAACPLSAYRCSSAGIPILRNCL